MAFLMLVAGIGLVVAGLLAIGFGIPIKEFSTGNTLIMAGVIGVCTGAIMLGLWVAVRELKTIARRLATGVPEAREEAVERPAPPVAAARQSAPAIGNFPEADEIGGPGTFSSAPAFTPAPPPPWQNEEVLRDHPIPEPLHPEPPSPVAKPKRNLMFSSTSRKERERTQVRSGEALPPDPICRRSCVPGRAKPPPPVETAEPPPAPFDDAWPRADRAKPAEMSPQRRSSRMSPPLAETNSGPAHGRDAPEVTVLKSGIVDGMAYSLYSDGSIEAEMPEGMMRFASIDELRVHLDQRSNGNLTAGWKIAPPSFRYPSYSPSRSVPLMLPIGYSGRAVFQSSQKVEP